MIKLISEIGNILQILSWLIKISLLFQNVFSDDGMGWAI